MVGNASRDASRFEVPRPCDNLMAEAFVDGAEEHYPEAGGRTCSPRMWNGHGEVDVDLEISARAVQVLLFVRTI